MAYSAHVDTFVRDRLPARELWPQLVFDLPELHYPKRLNCAAVLLDEALARGRGPRPALRFPLGHWSYEQLAATVNRICHVLVDDLGVVPGNRVLLRGANTPMLAACWLAAVKAGAVVVATMPLLRAKELGDVIGKAQITHALCEAALAEELELAAACSQTLDRILVFHHESGLEARMRGKPDDFDAVATAADDPAIVAFTSGTTGAPKGTVHFHRDLLAICDCFPRSILKPAPDDVFCGTPPLAFTFGLGGLLLFPLRIGASALLLPRNSPRGMLQAIAEQRANILFTAPTYYRMMLPELAAHDVSSLAKCVSAGEALPVDTRAQWKAATGIDIIDGIGATEMLHIFISAAGADIRPGATGKPIPGYRATILDAAGREAPPGSIGRLAVQGPTGCRYLDDERQAKYVENGWNITGDAYLRDADGYYWYQARNDDLIISAGYNIAGPEVEDALLTHPAVAECGVVGVPDATRGQVVKAFVVLRGGYAASQDLVAELQEHVKSRLAPYKYPRLVEFCASLPRTETGKLQRFRLKPQP